MKWIKNKDPKQQRRQFLITTTTTAATFQAKLDRQPAKEQIEEQKKERIYGVIHEEMNTIFMADAEWIHC